MPLLIWFVFGYIFPYGGYQPLAILFFIIAWLVILLVDPFSGIFNSFGISLIKYDTLPYPTTAGLILAYAIYVATVLLLYFFIKTVRNFYQRV